MLLREVHDGCGIPRGRVTRVSPYPPPPEESKQLVTDAAVVRDAMEEGKGELNADEGEEEDADKGDVTNNGANCLACDKPACPVGNLMRNTQNPFPPSTQAHISYNMGTGFPDIHCACAMWIQEEEHEEAAEGEEAVMRSKQNPFPPYVENCVRTEHGVKRARAITDEAKTPETSFRAGSGLDEFDRPHTRDRSSSSQIDAVVYATNNDPFGDTTRNIQYLDEQRGVWCVVDPPVAGLSEYASGAVMGPTLYIIYGELKTTWQFSLNGKGWLPCAALTEPRISHAVCVCNGRIYISGGLDLQPTSGSAGPGDLATSSMEAYDRKSGAWISCADMPRKRYGHTLCVDGHVILAVGGLGNDADKIATISSFDTLTGRWTARVTLIPEVPIPISLSPTAHGVPLWPAICVLNGFVYVLVVITELGLCKDTMFPQTLG